MQHLGACPRATTATAAASRSQHPAPTSAASRTQRPAPTSAASRTQRPAPTSAASRTQRPAPTFTFICESVSSPLAEADSPASRRAAREVLATPSIGFRDPPHRYFWSVRVRHCSLQRAKFEHKFLVPGVVNDAKQETRHSRHADLRLHPLSTWLFYSNLHCRSAAAAARKRSAASALSSLAAAASTALQAEGV